AEQSAREKFKVKLHDILLEKMDLKGLDSSHGTELIELTTQARAYIRELMRDHQEEVKPFGDPEALYQEIIDDILGYGPIADLLRDKEVSEIMCVGGSKVYVERKGKLTRTDKHFAGDSQLRAVIERIVGPLGRRIDESSPIVDARLPDGSRVNAIIHPIALDGPSLNIRKFPDKPMKIEDLIEFGSLTKGMGDFLEVAVKHRKNIIIAGGTGSGKTTLLDVVSSFIPSNERIVTIEDSAELRMEQDHVVRLESRPANIEGKGLIAIRDLVKNALRMRPDRIIVGECRGSEALDMLQAMNTGHDGSLTTLHANSPYDAISRLETMVLMAGMELPLRAIRSQIGSAVHIICHQARLSDGARKIMHISEVSMDTDDDDGEIHLQDIFIFVQTDIDKDGKVIGYYRPTGMIPAFISDMREHGQNVDMAMFVIEN
ncbi:MAG: CpaF family protein, partial [Spartobacteria bacterium]|nr:CpaF family protein [Spartobacteria bacterium]